MFRRNFILLSVCILIISLYDRCANPVSPQGGPKDKKPPKIERTVPPNFSTHFDNKEIEIVFDEYVQLKDPQMQITISPPYLPKADYRIRGKSIVIKLNDSLRNNTTYSVYFGDAISDITEGNILRNYSYVFSTGDYVDSLGLEGTVMDAFTLQTQSAVWVTLYLDNNDTLPLDSLPLHVPPFYRTRTDEKGHFIFHNLKDGKFLLFAVKDQNGNNYFDQPSETIAFYDSLVSGTYIPPLMADTSHLDSIARRDSIRRSDSIAGHITIQKHDSLGISKSSVPSYTLMMFEQQDSIQHILKKNLLSDRQIQLIFRYPLAQPSFEPLKFIPPGKWMIPEFSRKMDTVNIWLTSYTFDSLEIKISDKGKVVDTASFDLALKREKKKTTKAGVEFQPSLSLQTSPSDGNLNLFKSNPSITCSAPLEKYDFSRIRLVVGKDTLPATLAFSDSIRRKIDLLYKWKPDKKYLLIIPDSVFTGINGRSNDSLKFTFKTRAERDFGSIKITLKGKIEKGDLVLQLLGNNDAVVDQRLITGPSDVTFDYLLPAKYRFRLIFDANSNGKWDSGNYPKKLQPEKVLYYPKTIEVRGNWDIEENWEF